MNDTPAHIKKLQLEMWLNKLPGERLLQFIRDNEAMFNAFEEAKAKLKAQQNEIVSVSSKKEK